LGLFVYFHHFGDCPNKLLEHTTYALSQQSTPTKPFKADFWEQFSPCFWGTFFAGMDFLMLLSLSWLFVVFG